MQKVESSSLFSRLTRKPRSGGAFCLHAFEVGRVSRGAGALGAEPERVRRRTATGRDQRMVTTRRLVLPCRVSTSV
jgi:hypothetical protein